MYNKDMIMKDFARLGYFIIRYLNEHEMDEHVGGQPHFWCIPNHGDLFDYKDRPGWQKEFESHSTTMINNFKKYIVDEMS
jgi:hypothetical protein